VRGEVQAYRRAVQCSYHAEWPLPDARRRQHGAPYPEGLERCRKARWTHGQRSRVRLEEARQTRAKFRATWNVLTLGSQLERMAAELKAERAQLAEEREALRLAWEEIERERGRLTGNRA